MGLREPESLEPSSDGGYPEEPIVEEAGAAGEGNAEGDAEGDLEEPRG